MAIDLIQAAPFLRDIQANPDDDGVRLIFADWLEDNGHPDRADLIRVQCALAENPDDEELLAREQKLLKQDDFDKRCEDLDEPHRDCFQRGFRSIHITAENFLDPESGFNRAQRELACPFIAPLINGVTAKNMRDVIRHARDMGMNSLSLDASRDMATMIRALRRLPLKEKESIVHLTLTGGHLSDLNVLQQLGMPNLRSFCIEPFEYPSSCTQQGFARSKVLGYMPHLKKLNFSLSIEIDDNDASHIAASKGLCGVESLTVRDTKLSEKGVASLLGLSHSRHLYCLPGLKTLEIENVPPQHAGNIRALLAAVRKDPELRKNVPALEKIVLGAGEKAITFEIQPADELESVRPVAKNRGGRGPG